MDERPEEPEGTAGAGNPAAQLRALEEMIASSGGDDAATPGVRLLLERLRELIDAVDQFEASLQPAPGTGRAEPAGAQPGILSMTDETKRNEKATFGAGCFWGVEETFRRIPGVVSTAVGYLGGTTDNPTYEDVCTGRTGHAEVVQVEYDPSRVAYEALLDVFWKSHDPTQLNRQGPDVGTQYRSAIFHHTPEQHDAALASKERLEREKRFSRPIVTDITAASTFYRAEEYHQRYLEKRGQAHCHLPAY